jgi:uncharacterized protein YecE (DUF72 family)
MRGRVHIGPAGWSYEDWKGVVYPPSIPKGTHPLTILAPLFDTVEINATFYRPANPKHAESWITKVAPWPGFRFTAKLWEAYTHGTDWPTDAETQTFRDGLEPLVAAGKFGALLVQFPWSFKRTPANRMRLGKIADTFSGYPLVVELRHTSWNVPEVFEGFRARGIAFCNIDQPLFDDSIEPSEEVTAPVGYVRFHGRNAADWFRKDAHRNDRYNYLYSEEELAPWVERMNRMRRKVRDLYVVTNNHYQGQAVVNGIELAAALGRKVPPLPPHLIIKYPRLAHLVSSSHADV